MASKGKPRKPRGIDVERADFSGFFTDWGAEYSQRAPLAHVHASTHSPADLRRLAKWCLDAAAWLESRR